MRKKIASLILCMTAFFLSGSIIVFAGELRSFNRDTIIVQTPVKDSIAPVFSDCPASPVNLGCNPPAVSEKKAISDAGDVTDDSGGNIKLTAEGGAITGECDKSQTWIVTATDLSGNSSSCEVKYVWKDDREPPVVSLVEPVIIVECALNQVIPLPQVTDNCDSDPEFSFSDEIIRGVCNSDKGNLPASGNALKRDFLVEGTGIQANLLRQFQLEFEVNQGKGRAEFTLISPAGEAIILVGPYCEGGECDWPDPSYKPVYQPIFSSSEDNPVWNNNNVIPEGEGHFRPFGGNADSTPNEGYLAEEVPRFNGTYVSSFDQLTGPMDGTWTLYCRKNDNINGEIQFDGACMVPKCPEEYTILRTWTVTDDCGNTARVSQTIRIVDNTPPEITLPAGDLLQSCYDATAAEAWIASAYASDACCGTVTLTSSFTPPVDNCDQTVVVTFTATDNCNNTAIATKSFRVVDLIPPVLSGVPEGYSLECEEVSAVLPPGLVTASDNCDPEVTVSYEETIIDGECPDSYTILRTWTAADDCGNLVSATQAIIITDTTPPVLVGVPPDNTQECSMLALLETVTATDNCDPSVTVTIEILESDYSKGCGKLVRKWTATDRCGNTSSAVQTVTVVDTTPPVLSGVPGDYTMECDNIPAVLPPGPVTASDNCDPEVTVSFEETIIDGECPDSYTILRTWTAADDCGNLVSATQAIIITDTTPPVLVGVPPDNTQECSMLALLETVTATDNCDPSVTVTMEILESDYSKGCGKLVRKWTATDHCGNIVSAVQTITVVDNEPPVLVCPKDTVLSIPAGTGNVVWDYITPEVTDNCTHTESITIEGVRSDDKPLEAPWSEGITTITWTATDACMNTVSCVQTVTVKSGCLSVEAWVYLEGAAVDPEGTMAWTVPMRTTLNDLRILPGQLLVDNIMGNHYMPAGQPYNTDPWNYTGTEGSLFDSEEDPGQADAGYPATVTDWILVSLRDKPDVTYQTLCQAAALLHSDGHIEFVEAFDCCDLDLTVPYYVVIEHRNHLIIMSQEPVLPVSGVITCDFRTMQSYIDPLNPGLYVGQKEILPGIFTMYAGNGYQKSTEEGMENFDDTDINFNDRSTWDNNNSIFARYLTGDYNLNGDTNFNDRIPWENNNGRFTSVPR